MQWSRSGKKIGIHYVLPTVMRLRAAHDSIYRAKMADACVIQSTTSDD